jgi:hypothetical protein
MSDFRGFDEAWEGYVGRVNELLDEWTPFISTVSDKVDAGTYDANAVSADFPTAVKLVAQSLIGLGAEALDSLASLSSDFSEEELVLGYATDKAKAGAKRTLAVKADLNSVTGEVLPMDRVKPVPTELDPGITTFELDVDGDGMKARTYDGYIVATSPAIPPAPADIEEIPISVTIG